MAVRRTEWDGVFTDGPWLYTRNAIPGVAVYGEPLIPSKHGELRRWDAGRSKAAAYLKREGHRWPFRPSTSVLYLGAGSGTTVSHLSDICSRGTITAVEISHRVFRDLLSLSERRKNVIPILGDAAQPDSSWHLRDVDVLYQDVAQRDQEGIFLRNIQFLRPGGAGFLMIKSRSADVAADPKAVYGVARARLEDYGLEVLDLRTLDPFAEDHAALVVRKR